MCGVFGIGGSRDRDRQALRCAYDQLEPDGALLITDHHLPYASGNEKRWARWLPGHRADIPLEWPAEGNRKTASDGDEIEIQSRLARMDPLEQTATLEMRVRLWRGEQVLKEEAYSLDESLYFAQEVVMMLGEAGFRDVTIEGGFTGMPATPDDTVVAFVARR
jgi:hypothetical protein